MDLNNSAINRILEKEPREKYADRLQNVEIQNIMKYPIKESIYIVIYNLNVVGSYPIIKEKIMVDIQAEEILPYDLGLL